MIGIDTTALIDLCKGEPRIKNTLENIKEPLSSTYINYMELLFGIDTTKHSHREEKEFYEDLFSEITTLTMDSNSCEKGAEIFWNMNRQGKTIGKFDCVIAGIFIANGVSKVITRNAKHFQGIPGITVISY